MSVGQSERSKFKHILLNKLAGKIAGVASQLQRIDGTVFLDLGAGDGLANRYSDTSSPDIFATHIQFLAGRRKRGHGYFVESNQKTFSKLQHSIDRIALELSFPNLRNHATPLLVDYRDPALAAHLTNLTSNSVAFVYLEPNNVTGVELTNPLCSALPPLSTFLCTLGCNVGGLKRDQAQCQVSLNRINDIITWLVGVHHDAGLIWLEGDSSQWAYLLSIASRWCQETEKLLSKLRSDWPSRILWADDPSFQPVLRQLILTRAQSTAMEQPGLI